MNKATDDIDIRINHLSGDLKPLSDCAKRYLKFGAKMENDVIHVAPMTWIAPLANAFWLFEPVPRTWIPSDIDVPAQYMRILSVMNGCFAFNLALFGIPSPDGLLCRTVLRPQSLQLANSFWRQPFKAPADSFHFGVSPFNWEENVGYFMTEDGIVSLRMGGKVAGKWTHFPEFLAEELLRLEKQARKSKDAISTWGKYDA